MTKLKKINFILKIALIGLLVHAVWFNDLPQYKDKAIALRVVFYPLAAALTFIIWKIVQKRADKHIEYPHVVDVCLTFVVAFDLLGNTIAFYDKITWWDDIMHLLLTVPWVVVAGYLLRNKGFDRWVTAGLVVAYGSTSHIIWELLEYLSFVRSNPTELLTAYRDTMGDLTLSTIGTLIGAYITAKYIWKQSERKRNN
jgi:glycopeptide antibiotics resistance protein